METPPTVISPRPGDGQIRDSTLSLRRPNPGRSQGRRRDNPRAFSLPRGSRPHHSGDRPQRPRSCGNTCPVGSPLRRNAEVCACGAQRLVDQEGKPRRHLVRDETGAIRAGIDWITQITQITQRVPLHHRQPGGLRRPDRRRPGGGAAPLRGDRRRRQGAGNRNRRGLGLGLVRRHRALGQPGGPAQGRERRRDLKAWACPGPRSTGTWGRAGNAEQRPRPTSPRPVWPLRQAMTSQTNPHG